jgi:carboxypeptidase T
MKRILAILVFLFLSITAFSQTEKYSRIKIPVDDQSFVKLMGLGIPADEGFFDTNHNLVIELSENDITKLNTSGFSYDVIIDNVTKYYQERFDDDVTSTAKVKSVNCFNPPQYPVPTEFSLGSMGGFYTYQQILEELDTMALHYPSLITARIAADTTKTIEGRTIYYIKISDNPNVDESEPEVLYTALTHAREGVGMQQLFYYMYYLLENYSINNDVKNLVDNTEMYFILCANPDGYIFNESNYPTGGGMWRKNRRDNGDGNFGIDINRNFGYMWGYDDIGSSPNTYDETYRGASAFSEPETRIVKDFCNNHQIKITLNQHSYGNDLIYPWGYIGSLYTPDSLLFSEYARQLTNENYFTFGTVNETLSYLTNGGSDDWMYGEQSSKPKIISMTPESGTPADGFWPAANRITEICSSNIPMNLMTAKLAGKYAVATDFTPTYISQKQGYFDFTIERLGLESSATYTVSIQPLSSNIISVGNAIAFSGMNILESRADSISYTLDPFIQNGDKIKFLITVDNGLYTNSDTISKTYGPSFIIFSDDCSSTNNWFSPTGWDVTEESFVSAPSSISDSPYWNYMDSQSGSIETIIPVDLADALDATLTYEAKWAIQAAYDYVQVKISNDYGATWTSLCGKYSKPGNSFQASGEPVYEGVENKWVKESINLDDYLGQTVYFQFTLVSDGYMNLDGFYFDDVKVLALYDSLVSLPVELEQNIYLSDPTPNPSTDETIIKYNIKGSDVEMYFEITDISGRTVVRKKLSSTNGFIKISTLNIQSGIYNYCIRTNSNHSAVKKLMVTGM